ncbi:hypothetical protein TNCV_5027851 [Trichonephila clavipes]|nr:hypothetical protein TNCV_5027851 [Trichonephila clavipes]
MSRTAMVLQIKSRPPPSPVGEKVYLGGTAPLGGMSEKRRENFLLRGSTLCAKAMPLGSDKTVTRGYVSLLPLGAPGLRGN